LRPLLKVWLAQLAELRQRVTDLEAENLRLKQQLAGSSNSRNSSQPPSRDQKANAPRQKKRRQHGPPFGHQKSVRRLAAWPARITVDSASTVTVTAQSRIRQSMEML
jgi:hypothetical protein